MLFLGPKLMQYLIGTTCKHFNTLQVFMNLCPIGSFKLSNAMHRLSDFLGNKVNILTVAWFCIRSSSKFLLNYNIC